VSREAYETTIEPEKNLAVPWAVAVNAGWPPERRTAQWQTWPAVARRRGNAPAWMAAAAVFAAGACVLML
jgi:hypothetical protein